MDQDLERAEAELKKRKENLYEILDQVEDSNSLVVKSK